MAGLFARQIEIGRGIGGNDSRTAEPGEKPADAAETRQLRVNDQWFLGPGRAVLVKVKLIGFDSVAAEVRGRCEIPFPGPFQESTERPAMGVGGSL